MRDEDGRAKLYADIAHPINSLCREQIQQRVVEAYEREQEESERPDYVSRYDDYGEELEVDFVDEPPKRSPPSAPQPPQESSTPAAVEQQPAHQREKPRGPHKAPAKQPTQRRVHRPDHGARRYRAAVAVGLTGDG